MQQHDPDSGFSRRRFLQAGGAAAAGTLLGCGGGSEQNTAIVIGSGFAGSVAALRLGSAGIPTIVLERGMHWPSSGADSFPRVAGSNDGRTTWLGSVTGLSGQGSVPRYTGLIERVAGETLNAGCGAGVGGGSLVYGGVLLQPLRELFEQVLPGIDYEEMDRVYYPRVRAKVSGGPIPDDILASTQYRAAAEFLQSANAAGMSVKRADVGFDWNVIRAELQGTLPAAASVGEYIYGCNSGAKKSLDKNYLAEALATGQVSIKAQHQVRTIRKRQDGQFEVLGDIIDTQGQSVSEFVLVASHVFLAAGSLNTTKLMLRCKNSGDLPLLNEWVGRNWGGNGDENTMRFAAQTVSGSQGGRHRSPPPIWPIRSNRSSWCIRRPPSSPLRQ
jgi:cholesterol oxidase